MKFVVDAVDIQNLGVILFGVYRRNVYIYMGVYTLFNRAYFKPFEEAL